MKHLELLKSTVARQFGRPILNRPDSEQLSQDIFEKLHLHISYNTIRRFFSLADHQKHNASHATLTILAQYVGYKSFQSFNVVAKNIDPTLKIQEFLIQIQFSNTISSENTKQLIQNINEQHLLSTLLPGLIFTAFQKNDRAFLEQFFTLDKLFDKSNYLQYELFFALQLIGLQIREQSNLQKRLWEVWSQQTNGRLFYFEFFVDMDFLIVSHHKAIEHYLLYSRSAQDIIFAESLLCWKALWLNDKKNLEQSIKKLESHVLTKTIHPIPTARLYNCLLVFYKKQAQQSKYLKLIFEIERELISRQTDIDPFFHYWIIEGLVIVGEYDLCLQIIETIEDNWSQVMQRFYNHGAQIKTQIIKCRCLYALNQTKKAHQIFKLIDLENCYSFSRIYDQLFLPPEYLNGLAKQGQQLGYTDMMRMLNQKSPK